MDKLVIGNRELKSRLFIGTGKYASDKMIPDILKKSGAEVITVALRRVNLDDPEDNILSYIPKGVQILPNTSGARNAEEAVRIANLSRASGCGDWIKIEIIPDTKYLFPDNEETLKATKILASDGFVVLPYMNPDIVMSRKLADAGAAAVMPLGAPIGTNKGLKTKEHIKLMIQDSELPVIVDAGIGRPSHACEAMELGAAACLLNTAISSADNPVLMAEAFGEAVRAGRNAHLAGLGTVAEVARASSPLTGFLK